MIRKSGNRFSEKIMLQQRDEIMTENCAGTPTPNTKKRRVPGGKRRFLIMKSIRGIFVLGRPGSDLLSQGLSHSTIGAEEFNGRVRDGIGFKLLARTTRPAKDKETKQAVGLSSHGSRRAFALLTMRIIFRPHPEEAAKPPSRRMCRRDGH